MPKIRSKRRPTEEDKSAALAKAASQLEELDDQALRLMCERLGVEGSDELTRVGCVEAIKGVDRWHHTFKRIVGTKKFADQLALWNEIIERGMNPIKINMKIWWMQKLSTDDLRLLCSSLGVATEGDYLALYKRLEEMVDHDDYRSYLTSNWWWKEFCKTHQDQQWMGSTPTYSVSGPSPSLFNPPPLGDAPPPPEETSK